MEYAAARFALITGQPYDVITGLTPRELRTLTVVWNDMHKK